MKITSVMLSRVFLESSIFSVQQWNVAAEVLPGTCTIIVIPYMDTMKQWFRLFQLKTITPNVLNIYLKSLSETPEQTLYDCQGQEEQESWGKASGTVWGGQSHCIQARRKVQIQWWFTGSINVQRSSLGPYRWSRSKVKPESQVSVAQEEAKGDGLNLKAALSQGGTGLLYNCRSDSCTTPMLVLGPGSQTPGRSGAVNSGSQQHRFTVETSNLNF